MLSARVSSLKPSPTIALSAKLRELKEKGVDVIGFGAGEPDIDTPEFIKEACIRALKEGKTKYPPAGGIPPLREALSEKLLKVNGIKYSPSEIVVTVGAKLALFLIFQAVINEGDEVLLPTPYWVTYEEQIRLCGGTPVHLPLSFERGFSLSAEEVEKRITERTKLIILNSPTNPTGMVFDMKEVEKVARLCRDRGVLIISDECYESLIFDEVHYRSVASIGEDIREITFTVNSFSKTYSMTGWRVGYVACPEPYAKVIASLNSQYVSNTPTFAQYGALTALIHPSSTEFIERMREIYRRRRDLITDGLSSLPGIRVLKPQATFFIFPDFSEYTTAFGGDVKFSEEMLERAKVGAVPGSAFGAEGYLRMSFALSEENIERGIERIRKFLKEIA
jgi:aspartate aminotransferase